MSELVLTTFDWVPEAPRGWVRDLRIRWALEEAALPYRVETVSFKNRQKDHFDHQPFGQVPWLTDGEVSIFESGAILLYIGELSSAIMPQDAKGRSQVVQWLFAALNSLEVPSVPWTLYNFMKMDEGTAGRKFLSDWLNSRLTHLEGVLSQREWLAGAFSIADIAMADVLRTVDRFEALSDRPSCRAYVARAKDRPSFQKALTDQLTHFAAADRARDESKT
jgi:glutathione S-transferase